MNDRGMCAEWQATSEELIAGLCHELNGRLSALGGILQLALLDGLMDGGVGRQLESELDRLERLSRVLRNLGADRGAGPEPVRPAELLPMAVTLLRRHRELGEVEVELELDGDSLPVLAGWTPLLRLLVLLLARAARSAQRLGTGRVRAGLRHSEGAVLLAVAPAAPDSPATAAGHSDDPEDDVSAGLRDAALALGGTLTAAGRNRAETMLRLPAWSG